MALGLEGSERSPGGRSRPLGVLPMAVALVLAAFAGAGVGLVWQGSGLAEGSGADEEEGAAGSEAVEEGASPEAET